MSQGECKEMITEVNSCKTMKHPFDPHVHMPSSALLSGTLIKSQSICCGNWKMITEEKFEDDECLMCSLSDHTATSYESLSCSFLYSSTDGEYVYMNVLEWPTYNFECQADDIEAEIQSTRRIGREIIQNLCKNIIRRLFWKRRRQNKSKISVQSESKIIAKYLRTYRTRTKREVL